MHLWVAVVDLGGGEEILGVYTTEELALATADRAEPLSSFVKVFALDEIPGWIEEFEQDRAKGYI